MVNVSNVDGKKMVEDKNEALQKVVVVPRNVQNSKGKIMLGVDLGSTGTRTLVLNLVKGPVGKTIEIGSEYKVVTSDISHLPSKSDELVDRLEMVIEDVTAGKDTKVFESIHIVKANLVKDVQGNVPRTSSSTAKINQEATYVNAVSNVAIRLLMTASERSIRNTEYTTDLTVALPPADTQSRKNLEDFRSKLGGKYCVTFPRLGNVQVSFNINGDKILIEEESLAVLRYWATAYRQDLASYPRVLIFDGGGRSIDIGCIEDGRLRSDVSSSTAFGSNRMKTILASEYVNNTGNSKPNDAMLEEAVQTGFMQRGNSYIDVTAEIGIAKTQIAKEVITHINGVFDGNEDLSPDQINLILVAGGMFKETGVKGEPGYVPSLMAFVKQQYASINQDTKFSRISERHPIPLGLAYYRISKGDNQ